MKRFLPTGFNFKITKTGLFILLVSSLLLPGISNAQVGINATGAMPDPSSILDVKSNTKGFLPPRMTTVERNAIVNPAVGLVIFNTDNSCMEAWLGSFWGSSCFICSPQPSTANAGPDQLGNPVTLAANTPANGTGVWSFVTTDGNGVIANTGSPNSTFTGTPAYTYTLRWTITTACGSSQDDIVIQTSPCPSATFTDSRDSKTYNTVAIGTQCWMAENLAYLPSVVGSSTGSTNTAYYYVYEYNGTNLITAKSQSNYTSYGALYNWTAAMNGASSSSSSPSGVQGACPSGWHLPSDAEWCTMENTVEPGTDASCNIAGWRGSNTAGALKETGTTHWMSPNSGATNSSGFTALPSGFRNSGGNWSTSTYDAGWWGATDDGTGGWRRFVVADRTDVNRSAIDKSFAYAVRCVKD